MEPTKPFHELPTPTLDRWVGAVTGQALQMRADHHALIHRTMLECGGVARLRLFWEHAIVISSPSAARTVLQSDASNYSKQTMGYRELARVLGDGLFTADGPQWLDNRKVLQPFFTSSTLEHYAGRIRRHSDDLARSIQAGTIDMAEEMVALTLRILGDCIFDDDFEPYVPLMLEQFGTILEVVNARVVNHVPFVDTLNVARERRFRAALSRFDTAVAELIEKHLANPDREGTNSIIHALGAGEVTRDPKNVRDQVITMIFAGHETTAVALQWVFFALARNPVWRERVEAEVDATTSTDASDLPVLVRVVEETLRLYPPVWIVTRKIDGDVVIDGYGVKRGTLILVSPFTIHRNPELWEEPDVFDPDRFLPDRRARHVKGQYIPFGMGKRACVGSRMAMLELTTIVATLVRAWRFELAPGAATGMTSSLTLRPTGGMRMIATPRDAAPTGDEA